MLLCTIPGISHRAAEIILAEIGLDMTRFLRQTIWHHGRECVLANHESAGKRLSGRSRKGSPWLRKILVEAAHAPIRRIHTSPHSIGDSLPAVEPRRPWSQLVTRC